MPVRPNDDGNGQASSDSNDLPMDHDDKIKGLLGDVCDIADIQLERSLSLECADGQKFIRSTSRLKSKDIFDNDYTEAKCT